MHSATISISTRLPTNGKTADELLSGNVVAKLAGALAALHAVPDDVTFMRSVEALEKVQPEKIPFELLDFNLGERWIPTAYYNRFASQLFDIDTTVRYFQSMDTFKVNTGAGNTKTDQEYAVTTKNNSKTYGDVILEHALENTTPFYTYEVQVGDRTIRVADNEAIQLAHQKIESIREKFVQWLSSLPADDKKNIEELILTTSSIVMCFGNMMATTCSSRG